jgi:hypothetical protein
VILTVPWIQTDAGRVPDLPDGVRSWTRVAHDDETITVRILDRQWVEEQRIREREADLTPLVSAARIATRQMLRGEELGPEEVAEVAGLFPAWEVGIVVSVGEVYRWDGVLYETIQAHTTQADWEPQNVPALFAVLWQPVGDEPYPRWVAPTGAHDAYQIGDRVIHPNAQDGGTDWVFESKIDANTTEPGTDGTFHRWWEPISRLDTFTG